MKYRRKPVVVEAVRLGFNTWEELCQLIVMGRLDEGKAEMARVNGRLTVNVPTPVGLAIANEGDWIIKGAVGTLDVCKSDIFEQDYEPVDEG